MYDVEQIITLTSVDTIQKLTKRSGN